MSHTEVKAQIIANLHQQSVNSLVEALAASAVEVESLKAKNKELESQLSGIAKTATD